MKKKYIAAIVFLIFIMQSVYAVSYNYNYTGVTFPSSTHVAWFGYHTDGKPPNNVSLEIETEFNETYAGGLGGNYSEIADVDGTPAVFNLAGTNTYIAHKFRFETVDKTLVKNLTVRWFGTSWITIIPPTSNITEMYAWNVSSASWELIGNIDDGALAWLNVTKTDSSDYVNASDENSVHILLMSFNNTSGIGVADIVTEYIELEVFANDPPVVNLISPANQTNTTDNTTTHTFNFTDHYDATARCTLYYNGTSKANNASVLNNTNTDLTPTEQANGIYIWWINCSDGEEEAKSEERILNISEVPPPPPDQNCTYSIRYVQGQLRFNNNQSQCNQIWNCSYSYSTLAPTTSTLLDLLPILLIAVVLIVIIGGVFSGRISIMAVVVLILAFFILFGVFNTETAWIDAGATASNNFTNPTITVWYNLSHINIATNSETVTNGTYNLERE